MKPRLLTEAHARSSPQSMPAARLRDNALTSQGAYRLEDRHLREAKIMRRRCSFAVAILLGAGSIAAITGAAAQERSAPVPRPELAAQAGAWVVELTRIQGLPHTASLEYSARLDARRATGDALSGADARLAHARCGTC